MKRILLVCLLASALLSAPTSAAAADVYPELAGTTTVHADGVTGVKLLVPRDVVWRRANISLEFPESTNLVRALIRYQGDASELCDLCFLGTFASAESRDREWRTIGGCEDDNFNEIGCTISAGVIELYLVADGPFTFTMRFPELAGALELHATGTVDGHVQRLPVKCVIADCSIVGGGVTRPVGLDGKAAFSSAVAWVRNEPGAVQSLNPAQMKATACAYPGFMSGDKSPDPQDHPYGCDVTDHQDQWAVSVWLPVTFLGEGTVGASDGALKTHGDQYLGFTARAHTTLAPAQFTAFGYWLNEGISCPSGNYFDC